MNNLLKNIHFSSSQMSVKTLSKHPELYQAFILTTDAPDFANEQYCHREI